MSKRKKFYTLPAAEQQPEAAGGSQRP